MSDPKPACLVCEQTSDQVPLLAVTYQSNTYWICPSHFPIMIHKPSMLVGKLPGAENLKAHEHD
jgi:hypothetical protein